MNDLSEPTLTDDLIWHPYTRHSAFDNGPLPVIERGDGVYLIDDQGRHYFDAISTWWACSLGHGHRKVLSAIHKQTDFLQHSILGNLSHPGALSLAQRLSDLTGGDRRVHFASDGSSAIEAALKIAIQYADNLGHTGKHAFLSLTDPYHGDTLGAVSVGYMELFHRAFKPVLFKTYTTPTPVCTECGCSIDPGACDAPCFRATEQALGRHRDELAAVVVEPLCQGAGGMRMYGAAYLRRLAERCHEWHIPLIVDEIAMGFCKTGRMFAYEHAGIDPDIVCVGKALSAGYLPISAALVRDRIYETFSDDPVDRTFYHGHTFAGNPIAVAASEAALDVYEDERLWQRARDIGRLLEQELMPLQSHPGVKDVRFLGAIAAVEFKDPADAWSTRHQLFDQGILARPLGPVLYLIPPLIASDDQVLYLASTLRSSAS